ncbi:MAG: ankyrin repeat domain-containing protein [Bacteroidota bacterium]
MSSLKNIVIKKYKQKTYIVFLLCAALACPLQAAQPILKDNTTKDGNYKTLVSLFEIKGIGLKIVKYIDCKDKDRGTALHWSAGLGYLDCVKYLVQQGATRDKDGNTALHLSAKYGHLNIVKYLIENGADIHKKNKYGNTALHLSAKYVHLNIVKYLIENNALINPKSGYGNTALLRSIYKRHLDCVKYLLQQGAYISI